MRQNSASAFLSTLASYTGYTAVTPSPPRLAVRDRPRARRRADAIFSMTPRSSQLGDAVIACRTRRSNSCISTCCSPSRLSSVSLAMSVVTTWLASATPWSAIIHNSVSPGHTQTQIDRSVVVQRGGWHTARGREAGHARSSRKARCGGNPARDSRLSPHCPAWALDGVRHTARWKMGDNSPHLTAVLDSNGDQKCIRTLCTKVMARCVM